jgi:dTDP-4-amino-4,6-dideoxygalactose transaminase
LPTAASENLPVANKTSQNVLCLPIFVELESEIVKRIVEIISFIDK